MRSGPLKNGVSYINANRRHLRKVEALIARNKPKRIPPKPPMTSIHTYHDQEGGCLHYPCEYHPGRKPPNELLEFTVSLLKILGFLIVISLIAFWFGQ